MPSPNDVIERARAASLGHLREVRSARKASSATPAEKSLLGAGVPLGFSAAAPSLFAEPMNPEDPAAVRAVAKHFTLLDGQPWPAPHFKPQELASRSDGLIYIRPSELERLEKLRSTLARPLIVTSAYRSPKHNAKVGGATRSKHMLGMAFDIRMDNFRSLDDIRAFREAARAVGFTAVVDYPESGFVHIDARPGGGNWSANGAVRAVDGDPGFAGAAWDRALADEDGRGAKKADKAVNTGAVLATAAAGSGAMEALAPPESANWYLDTALKLLPYGLPVLGAVMAGYLIVIYWGRIWSHFSPR